MVDSPFQGRCPTCDHPLPDGPASLARLSRIQAARAAQVKSKAGDHVQDDADMLFGSIGLPTSLPPADSPFTMADKNAVRLSGSDTDDPPSTRSRTVRDKAIAVDCVGDSSQPLQAVTTPPQTNPIKLILHPPSKNRTLMNPLSERKVKLIFNQVLTFYEASGKDELQKMLWKVAKKMDVEDVSDLRFYAFTENHGDDKEDQLQRLWVHETADSVSKL